jgi:hypothetical protein
MPLVDNAWYVNGSTGVVVADLGSAQNSAGATLTLSITVPAGALICVVASEVTSASAGTMADATNGAYSVATSGAMSGAAGFGTVFYFANSAALTAVTLTYTKQTTGRASSIAAIYATGIATTTPLDAPFSNTSAVNSATPTVTSATTPVGNGELVVGACAYSNAVAKTLTNTGAFTIPFANQTGQATASVGGGHLNVNGTLGVTFNPTLSGASDNVTMLVAFKPSGSLVGWWNTTIWAASTTKVCGNLVRQNATQIQTTIPNAANTCPERMFVCIASTAGTGQTGGSEPTWTTTRGGKTTDNTVTWMEATGIPALNGDLSANTPTWNTVKNTAIVQGQVIQNVAGTLVLICTTAGTAGNGAEPSWAAFTNAGATTVDNGATWTTLGASFPNWGAPAARLGNAMGTNWGQAGNTFYIASEHAEVYDVAVGSNVLGPGTLASPCFHYCVNKSNVPPTSANLTTGAVVWIAQPISVIGIADDGYYYGLTLKVSSGITNNSFALANTSLTQYWQNCAIGKFGGTGNVGLIGGATGGTITLDNTTLQFNNVVDTLRLGGNVLWKNTASAILGAIPTTLIPSGQATTGLHRFEGVDLSAFGAGKTIVGAVGTNSVGALILKDCKLGASVTVAATNTNTAAYPVYVVRSDSAGTNYIEQVYTSFGTQIDETVIVRTGGATDGTTPKSRNITTSSAAKWIRPFESDPIAIWNDSTNPITTLSIFGTTTGGGVPNNDDIWIDVEYLGSNTSPQGSFQTTTKANNLAASTTTNNSADGSTWGGAGAGNGFKILCPSFTPAQKGYIYVYIKVAKATSTYYVDPKVVI